VALHPTEMPVPDPSATSAATGCEFTPYAEEPPSPSETGLQFDHDATKWFAGDGLTVAPDPSFGGRWYSGGIEVIWVSDVIGSLNIEGERVDADAPPLTTAFTFTNPDTTGGFFNALYFSQPGCWQVRATKGDASVEFVTYVMPLEERPDVQEQLARRAAIKPFPVPGDCPATSIDHAKFQQWVHHEAPLEYVISGDGIALSGQPDLLFEGENVLGIQADEFDDPQLRGNLVGEPGLTLRSTGIRSAGATGEYWRATVVFPAAGCWEVQATSGPYQLNATLYVYPADCHVEPGHEPADSCAPPGA
jgi:hypothetical protein